MVAILLRSAEVLRKGSRVRGEYIFYFDCQRGSRKFGEGKILRAGIFYTAKSTEV